MDRCGISTKYDLYLRQGCNCLPDFRDLDHEVSFVTYPTFQQWIVQQTPTVLGFLQVSLTEPVARALLQRLRSGGAVGFIIKDGYRQPKVSLANAYRLADQELTRRQEQKFPGYTFKPVAFHQERPQTWRFVCACPPLIEEGYIPGALFADVDKIDGHIWQQEEYQEE